MPTLLMRLSGPMQSWGAQSRFRYRDTSQEPTLSGIIGIIASADGRERTDDVSDLIPSRFGLRVLKEGRIQRDFQTYERYSFTKDNSLKRGGIGLSYRDFLSSADFLAGLEYDDHEMPKRIQSALMNPARFLWLGRKSFAPALPIWIKDGVVDLPLLDALRSFEPPDSIPNDGRFRYVVDAAAELIPSIKVIGENTVWDLPISFAERRFLPRQTVTFFLDAISNDFDNNTEDT